MMPSLGKAHLFQRVKIGNLMNGVGLTIGLKRSYQLSTVMNAPPYLFPFLGAGSTVEIKFVFLDFLDHNSNGDCPTSTD